MKIKTPVLLLAELKCTYISYGLGASRSENFCGNHGPIACQPALSHLTSNRRGSIGLARNMYNNEGQLQPMSIGSTEHLGSVS